MQKKYILTPDGTVFAEDYALDTKTWTKRPADRPDTAPQMSAEELFQQLGQSASCRNLVVGIIGPREATKDQYATAEHIGRRLGALGLTLICGGRSGVMEAASKGCFASSGTMIGILPGSHPQEANPFVTIPLPTGLGEARNMVIAKSARVLIAVGGSYGTLSEVAYGLHFSKPVVGVEGAPDVDGVIHAASPEDAVERALDALISSAPTAECNISDKDSHDR
jgi:uncharacterized protein (TIGR00725 family)